jgi:hypothetical protein
MHKKEITRLISLPPHQFDQQQICMNLHRSLAKWTRPILNLLDLFSTLDAKPGGLHLDTQGIPSSIY